jgi:hypothetical protein
MSREAWKPASGPTGTYFSAIFARSAPKVWLLKKARPSTVPARMALPG